ncbi:MAG TPA: DinB family protein [Chloroflexia bacterium]|jgi:uncharacterized damage-inducible protein DinB
MTAPTAGVSQLLYLLDDAFRGPKWHSLLGNLQSVTPDDWLWVPPGGRRSIRDIVDHVGSAKLIYQNYAFGDAKLTWDDSSVVGGDRVSTISSAIEWLEQAQERLRQSIANLDDEELLRPRMHFTGVPKETRWLIAVMLEHDLYHAGELNHIRCLHQQNDE